MARPGSPAFREPGRGHADQREAHSSFYPVGLLLFLITTEVLWFVALKQFVEQIFKICETQWQIPHGHSRPEPLGFSRADLSPYVGRVWLEPYRSQGSPASLPTVTTRSNENGARSRYIRLEASGRFPTF